MESQEGRSPPARVIGLLCLNDESVDYSRPTPMSNGCHLSVPFNQWTSVVENELLKRDVEAGDRDETETLPDFLETETFQKSEARPRLHAWIFVSILDRRASLWRE